MNFITQKQFPRRAFLRGAGATLALPFLDAMVPAGRSRAIAKTAAAQNYKMSAFILGVIKSDAFLMKQADPVSTDANVGRP